MTSTASRRSGPTSLRALSVQRAAKGNWRLVYPPSIWTRFREGLTNSAGGWLARNRETLLLITQVQRRATRGIRRDLRTVAAATIPIIHALAVPSVPASAPYSGAIDEKAGISRRMKASNSGTVNAVSPCAGLKIIPFEISVLRMGATLVTFAP